jgi:hypothetical protein
LYRNNPLVKFFNYYFSTTTTKKQQKNKKEQKKKERGERMRERERKIKYRRR